MGIPRFPGGRVIGNLRHQGSLNDGRLGPLTGGQGHHNSYTNPNRGKSINVHLY